MSELLLRGGHVVTMDDAGSEHADGWVLVRDGLVAAVGGGAEPPKRDDRVDLGGALVTPGLVNTHHHLYQTLTRARAQDSTLFEWLVELYPVWAGLDAEAEYAAARTGLAELALSGCSTVFDHHYVFPRGRTGILEAELQAARELGLRFVASRGSMDLGEAQGGLPPDSLVETIDEILADTERVAALADGDLLQIAVAPCSPFSVTRELMERVGGARAAPRPEAAHAPGRDRRGGRVLQRALRLHAGRVPRGRRLAGGRRLVRALRAPARRRLPRFAAHGVGIAHCPTSNLRLGAGFAPVREMLDAGVDVGLGVDGTASNERGDLMLEVKQALLVARGRGGPRAMTARDALRLGTRGGAAVLGRDDIGSLEPGKRADIAVWRADGLELAGARRRSASRGSSSRGPIASTGSTSAATPVVRDGHLVRADEDEIAREQRAQARRF